MKKSLMIIVMIAILFVLNPIPSLASCPQSSPNTPILGSKCDRGIRRISWYIDYNSGAGAYEFLLINATRNWENPGWPNQIRFVASNNNNGTMLDVYRKNNNFWQLYYNIYGSYPLAETKSYSITGDELNLFDVSTYRFTRIYLNHRITFTIFV